MYRLEVASPLTSELEQSWKNKIAVEFNINPIEIIIDVNPDLILGYKLSINDKIYDHSFRNSLENDLAVVNKKLNQ